jgi:beta-glucosidase
VTVTFPDGFLWGTATSAYQIEGAVEEDGRGTSIWDTFTHTPGTIHHGDTGDVATDHYHRFEDDLDLMARLGLTAYRFSVAWPRILPAGTGYVNEAGLDFYRRLVDGLLERSIVPALTLYHWDLPQALQDRGGWTNRDVAGWFADYAGIVYEALGDRISLWMTLNEPWVSAWAGHGSGVHAPGVKDDAQALVASHHLLLAHGTAAQALRAGRGEGRIGITLNLSPTPPASDDESDIAAARRADGYYNRLYLDPLFHARYPEDIRDSFRSVSDFGFVRDGDLETIAAGIDFLGVNFYTRHMIAAAPGPRDGSSRDLPEPLEATIVRAPGVASTALGWGIEPEGLTELLTRIRDEYTSLPIHVTENGAGFNDYVNPEGLVEDPERIEFLEAHFRAAHEAIRQGVDLRGYFVWSLMDNFEWALGYSARFGIVFVDYGTQTRIPKRSAGWYADVIRCNGLPERRRGGP